MSLCGRNLVVHLPKFEYITVFEIALHLNVSERTVRRWIAAGKIPSVRVGREHRIPVKDFKEFIRSCASRPETLYQELDKPSVPEETPPPATQPGESEVEKVEKYDGPIPPVDAATASRFLDGARFNKI